MQVGRDDDDATAVLEQVDELVQQVQVPKVIDAQRLLEAVGRLPQRAQVRRVQDDAAQRHALTIL